MTAFKRRDVILVQFPFSDYLYSKKRPAMVLVEIPGRDELICMMLTSTLSIDQKVDIPIKDIKSAGLPKPTVARTSRLFTLKPNMVIKKLGQVNGNEFDKIIQKLTNLFRSE